MDIRKAKPNDLEAILPIYAYARQQMAKNGNPSQWGADKPTLEAIQQDIQQGILFLVESCGQAVGVFAFFLGEEPTYQKIEGKWLNSLPYGVIHRIASNGGQKGILGKCLQFCGAFTNNIRIDTHEQNFVMRRLLEKNGFQECGTVYVEDNTPRIAFQRYAKED
jgi:RimJ/RimL family protein N-acetyltransferase